MILLKKQLLGGIKMADVKISDSIVYIGVDDKDIDLFESCLLYTSDAADEL